jgi:hypothetical protein
MLHLMVVLDLRECTARTDQPCFSTYRWWTCFSNACCLTAKNILVGSRKTLSGKKQHFRFTLIALLISVVEFKALRDALTSYSFFLKLLPFLLKKKCCR